MPTTDPLIKSRVMFRRPRVRVRRRELVAKRYVCYELQMREHSCAEMKRWVTVEAYDYFYNALRIAKAVHVAFGDGKCPPRT